LPFPDDAEIGEACFNGFNGKTAFRDDAGNDETCSNGFSGNAAFFDEAGTGETCFNGFSGGNMTFRGTSCFVAAEAVGFTCDFWVLLSWF